MTDLNPKILTIRLMEAELDGVPVEIEFGNDKLVKKIPNGRGLSRMNLILVSGKVDNVELVTEKL